MALGADGVWTGSIWLTVAENTQGGVVTEKLLAATSTDTVRSRAFTGKPARQLRTAWTDAWEAPESPGTLPDAAAVHPQRLRHPQDGLQPAHGARRHARRSDRQPHEQIRSSKAVVQEMVEEYVDTTTKLVDDLTDA